MDDMISWSNYFQISWWIYLFIYTCPVIYQQYDSFLIKVIVFLQLKFRLKIFIHCYVWVIKKIYNKAQNWNEIDKVDLISIKTWNKIEKYFDRKLILFANYKLQAVGICLKNRSFCKDITFISICTQAFYILILNVNIRC